MDEFIKVSDTELKVIKEEVKQSEHTFTISYLLEQKKAILAQKAREIAQRDAELVIVDELIAKCSELGIKEVAVIKEPIPITK